MKTLAVFVFVIFLSCFCGIASRGEQPSFNKEDFIENLIEAPSLEGLKEFETLGYLNDETLIEMKVDLTNYKRSILTIVAEIMEKNIPKDPTPEQRKEIEKMEKVVQRCSFLENNIWLIIKIRRLQDQRMREQNMLAEKLPPNRMQ